MLSISIKADLSNKNDAEVVNLNCPHQPKKDIPQTKIQSSIQNEFSSIQNEEFSLLILTKSLQNT